jgi:hypothetical protein
MKTLAASKTCNSANWLVCFHEPEYQNLKPSLRQKSLKLTCDTSSAEHMSGMCRFFEFFSTGFSMLSTGRLSVLASAIMDMSFRQTVFGEPPQYSLMYAL